MVRGAWERQAPGGWGKESGEDLRGGPRSGTMGDWRRLPKRWGWLTGRFCTAWAQHARSTQQYVSFPVTALKSTRHGGATSTGSYTQAGPSADRHSSEQGIAWSPACITEWFRRFPVIYRCLDRGRGTTTICVGTAIAQFSTATARYWPPITGKWPSAHGTWHGAEYWQNSRALPDAVAILVRCVKGHRPSGNASLPAQAPKGGARWVAMPRTH